MSEVISRLRDLPEDLRRIVEAYRRTDYTHVEMIDILPWRTSAHWGGARCRLPTTIDVEVQVICKKCARDYPAIWDNAATLRSRLERCGSLRARRVYRFPAGKKLVLTSYLHVDRVVSYLQDDRVVIRRPMDCLYTFIIR